jgi:hypothetical protein
VALNLKGALAHVLWIGGATDSGKTSVARALAERHGLQEYHFDLYDRTAPPGHWARIDPARHPHMQATRVDDPDWMWVDTSPQELVERWMGTAPERFSLTVEDLLALPAERPIVAEGYGFTPALVRPLLTSTNQAIWLVSTDEFKRATYARRGKGAFATTRDPARARANHIGRDLLLGASIRAQAEGLGLIVIDVDGSQTLEAIIARVEAHVAPYVSSSGLAW